MNLTERVEDALQQIARGELAVLIDDRDVGALVRSARRVTAEDVVFMLAAGRGLVTVALPRERCEELKLDLQPGRENGASGHPFTVSVDARIGTTTGISAEERANTIRVVADPDAGPDDLIRPGHIQPMKAHAVGVLGRRGQAEAAVDLVRLATGEDGAAVCTILDEQGATASPAAARALAERNGLPTVTLTELSSYRYLRERPLEPAGRERLATVHGDIASIVFTDRVSGARHLSLVRGSVAGREGVPVALHRASPTEDLLAGLARNCGEPLAVTLRRFSREGVGVLVYLERASARGQEAFDVVAQVLGELAPASVTLLDSDPGVEDRLRERGIAIARRAGTMREALSERSYHPWGSRPAPGLAWIPLSGFETAV